MNWGIVAKSVREMWRLTLICGVAVGTIECVFMYAIPRFFSDTPAQLFANPFVKNIIRGLIGTEFGDMVGATVVPSIAWVHPVVLALTWAHAITLCTRLPAGEIEGGTIDILLSWPVSRTRVFCSVTIVWLAAGAFVILMALTGNLVGALYAPVEFRYTARQLIMVVTNLFLLYAAVGGITFLASSLCSQRGQAVGIALGIVIGSFFLNFLSQLWAPAKSLAFLGMLHYYRPFAILHDADWPVGDILALALIGVTSWAVAAVIFSRRDVCTV